MGKVDERMDARADRDYARAFRIGQEILARKGSKRLIDAEIDECLHDLRLAGGLELLPPGFDLRSLYGQQAALDGVVLKT